MRRLAFAIALLSLAPATRGDDVSVDIRDFGGKADGVTDNAPAFTEAIAAAAGKVSAAYPGRATVRVPAATKPYIVKKPIMLDRPDIWIVGDGPQSCIQINGTGPTLIVGVKETEPGTNGTTVALPETANPSRAGVLDGSLGGFGVRTGGDSTVAFAGTPFDLGPRDPSGGMSGWSVPTIVVDIAIERNADGGAWPGGKVEGVLMLGGYQNSPVLLVQKSGIANTSDFILTDSAGNRGQFSVSLGTRPVKRVSAQIDLAGKTVAAWADGIRVQANPSGPAFGPAGSGRLLANRRDAMILGASTQDADGRPPVASPGSRLTDWTFWGLSLSDRPKYRVGPLGGLQEALDGRPTNDAHRYQYGFGWKPVACLLGSLDASPSRRLVEGFSGTNASRRFYGYQLQVGQCKVLGGQQRNGIRDLQLIGPGPFAGPTVQLFSLLDFRAERCRISGGTQGIGVLHGLATYPISIDDCDISASDSPVFAVWSSVDIFRSRFAGVGRAAVRSWASNVTMLDCRMVFGQHNTDALIASHAGLYGGRTTVARLEANFEGEVCRVAPFFVERNAGLTTTFSAEDVYLGSAANGRPIVATSQMGAGSKPFIVELRRIDDDGKSTAPVAGTAAPTSGVSAP